MKLSRLLAVLVMLVLGLALSACGGDDEEPAPAAGHTEMGGETSSSGPAVDRAFAQAMIPHHESAIEMAEIALERGESAFVRTLAKDIVRAQEREIETLARIDGDLEGEGVEAGDLGVPEHMQGMDASAAELETADPFDKAFVDMMIPHHEGAIAMAKAELEKGENSELKALAQDIIDAQQREIDEMTAFLEREYGAAAGDDAMGSHGE